MLLKNVQIKSELSKIAIWSATGSGKTLLLHVDMSSSILHYAKKYGKKDFNKVTAWLLQTRACLLNILKEFKDSNIWMLRFSAKSSGSMFSGECS